MGEGAFLAAARVWVASRASKATRDAYGRDLRHWEAFCQRAGVDPGGPPAEAAIAFRDELIAAWAPLTVRRILATLAAAFSAVTPAAVNPFNEKKLPRPPASDFTRTESVPKELALDVIEAAGASGRMARRNRAIAWVLWSTGMRRVSLVSIRRRDILRKLDGTIVFRHVIKGGEVVESELAELDAIYAVDAWLGEAPASEWLFCAASGVQLTPQAVTKVIGEASDAVGVHVHPHQFRSAVITDAIDANISLERVRALVHHKDIRSTLRYDRGQRGAGVAAELARHRAKIGSSE